MAGMLSGVTKGKIKRPVLMCLYGPDGIGKTTFGADAPNPIFLGGERGTDNLDVARFPQPKTWAEVYQAIGELVTEKHDFKSLIVDTLDWIEPLLHSQICQEHNAKTIELACGGYGKGYVEATNHWQRLTKELDKLRDQRGMHVILLAHSEVKTFNDPENQITYDRFQLKLHKNAAAVIREWVDAVLFANLQVYQKKDGAQTRAYGDGARIMYSERRPGFDAKNRLGLPFQLPLSWAAYVEAAEKGNPESVEAVMVRVDALLDEFKIKQPAMFQKAADFIKAANGDVRKLIACETRMLVLLNGTTTGTVAQPAPAATPPAQPAEPAAPAAPAPTAPAPEKK